MTKVKRETTQSYLDELKKQRAKHELSKNIARLVAMANQKRIR